MSSGTWLDTVMCAAVAAPSGDNLQPWEFVLDRGRHELRVRAVADRDPSPMNAGNVMARISVGAVAANIALCHVANGRPVPGIEFKSSQVVITGLDPDAPAGVVPHVLLERHTNRLVYYAGQTSKMEFDRLRQEMAELSACFDYLAGEVGLREPGLLITDRRRIERLAELIALADEILFTHRAARRAFLDAVRLGEAQEEYPAPEGLPVATLGLGPVDRAGMRLALQLSDVWLDRLRFASRAAARARRLVQSADGLWIWLCEGHDETDDYVVGGAAQAMWLAVTANHLACQPMMSIPVLQSMERRGAIASALVGPLWERLRAELPEADGARVGFILRIGAAPTPRARTGRLPWQRLMVIEPERVASQPVPSHSMSARSKPVSTVSARLSDGAAGV